MCCDEKQEKEIQLQTKQKHLKIVILGDSSVGKTSIISKFCYDTFSVKESTTLGVAYQSSKINIKGEEIKLHIWDTAGGEKYRSLTQLSYRDANIAIIVYDITNQKSFESITYWDVKDICIGLAGNKCDQKDLRVVNKNKVREYAENNDLIFQETCAIDGEGIQLLFALLVEKYIKNQKTIKQ